MKVCFTGVGSIAKRHISNLRKIADEGEFKISIDAVRRADSHDSDICLDYVYHSCADLTNNYDAIFITNPTDFHIDTLNEVAGKSNNFFIEKPLTTVRKLDAVRKFQADKNTLYYVACPLRYTNVIQYLKEYVGKNRITGVRCISSSYLPEWRPGIDYRRTYSAHKNLGGGVSIDLIHEWDYLKFLFGIPEKIIYIGGKKSDLEIDCEDTALYIADYDDKFVELHLDYFGKKTIREVMIFTENETIIGDLVKSKVSFLKSGRVIDFGEQRDDFQKKELRHFLELMKTRKSNNTIQDAYETILLTQGILEDK